MLRLLACLFLLAAAAAARNVTLASLLYLDATGIQLQKAVALAARDVMAQGILDPGIGLSILFADTENKPTLAGTEALEAIQVKRGG